MAITIVAEKVEEAASSKELVKVEENKTAVSVAETHAEPLTGEIEEEADREEKAAERQTEAQDDEIEAEDVLNASSEIEVLR